MTAAIPFHHDLDAIDAFRQAISEAGLKPPEMIVADSVIHRFPSDGTRGDDAGWYVLHGDGIPVGTFGCWRRGFKENWQQSLGRPLTATEEARQQARISTARELAEAEMARRQADAAKEAEGIWKESLPASGDHPYLVKKAIQTHGVRQQGKTLIVPVRVGTELHSIQYIQGDGTKRFLRGGQVAGGYYSIGKMEGATRLCVAEGFATGATVHEATGYPVAVAFNAGNLKPVVESFHHRYPGLSLVVCGDDDSAVEENPGRTKATEAAQSVGARLALPERSDGVTDFNDLAARCGPEAVKRAVAAASEPDAEKWPELVSLDMPRLPRLDLTHLPSWAGNFAVALATATETPPEMAAGQVIATCSAAAARRLRVMVQPGYFEPCNNWIVTALPSGNRKSAVEAAASAPLAAWERDEAAKRRPEILRLDSERKTQEARAKELRNRSAKEKDSAVAKDLAKQAADIEANLVEVPVEPQLWTSDATPERMGTLLADNGERMAWLSSEGGIFDLLQGRYSSGILNLDLMLKSWSGDSERVDRGSRPAVYLQHPLLTIGLSPQPDVLRGLATKPGFRGRGLLARFLYLLPPSPLGYRRLDASPIPDGVRDAYAAGVRAMLDWKPATGDNGEEQPPHLLRLSADAYREWLTFAKYIEHAMRPGGDFETATDWAGKAPGVAVRLAGVLHGIRHAHDVPWAVEISVETMTDALGIMSVIARHSLTALEWMGADESVAAARRVWQWVNEGRRDRFTVREAHQVLKGTFPRVKGLREALEVLEERGYLVIDEPRTGKPGRRPSPVVRVRPDITGAWR